MTVTENLSPTYDIKGLLAEEYAMIVAALNMSPVNAENEDYVERETALWKALRDAGKEYGIEGMVQS